MNFIKTVGILLLILVLAILAMGFVQPKKYNFSRTIEIKATQAQVYSNVSSWNKWKLWSPWLDSTMFSKIEGKDGKVGTRINWKNNTPGTIQGNMTFVSLSKEKVDFTINLIGEYDKQHNGYISLTPDAIGNTIVTWSLNGENGFFERVATFLWDMEAMLGPDLEKGLEKLKLVTEEQKGIKKPKINEIKEFLMPTTLYLMKKVKLVSIEETKNIEFYTKHVEELLEYANENNAKILGPVTSLYFTWDTLKNKTAMSVAIPIDSMVKENYLFKMYKVKASAASKIEYLGEYDGLDNIHEKLNKYFLVNGLKGVSPAIEVFNVNPSKESNPKNWKTTVIYMHK